MLKEDILSKLLNMQKDMQSKYDYDPSVCDCASAIMTEAGETWDISGGKWWKNYLKDSHKYFFKGTKGHQYDECVKDYEDAVADVNSDKVKEELIDILHFWLCACLKMNMSAEEIFDIYCKKMDVNKDRQENNY